MSEQVTISRVSARCREDQEPLHVRLRLSHLLSTADFQPAGLPPQAILLIRHLKSPLSLDLQRVCVPPHWQRTLQSETTALFQRAVRPYKGTIPPDAAAVLFCDRAELLACMGVLTTKPEPQTFWIWQSVVGSRSPSPSPGDLTRLWRQSPRFVPAALEILTLWQEALPLLKTVSESQIETLFNAVAYELNLAFTVQDFDLLGLNPLSGEPFRETQESIREAEPEIVRSDKGDWTSSLSSSSRPFGRSSLRNEKTPSEDLMELPGWLREREKEWSVLSSSARSLLLLSHAIVSSPSLSQSAKILQTVSYLQQAKLPVSEGKMSEALLQPAQNAAERDPVGPPPSETASEPGEYAALEPVPFSEAGVKGPPARTDRNLSPTPVELSELLEPLPTERPGPWNGLEGIPTRLGGVFYLVNLFLRRSAPSCFDTEFPLSDYLTLWGLTQLFAQHLLAGTEEEYDSDPIWELLARLDNRRHKERIAPHLPHRETALKTVFEVLEADLTQGIGEQHRTALLRVPATLYVTRIHIDVVISIDRIFMPARIAGLDADPGWIPELTRLLSFHFE